MVKTDRSLETPAPETPPKKKGRKKKSDAKEVTPIKILPDVEGDTNKKERKSPKKTVSISTKRTFDVRFLLLLFIDTSDTNIYFLWGTP